MIVGLVAPKGLPDDVATTILAASDTLANDADTNSFITEQLLMLPVTWGRGHAEESLKDLYDLFGEQAKSQ